MYKICPLFTKGHTHKSTNTLGPWLLRISLVWFSLMHSFKNLPKILSHANFMYSFLIAHALWSVINLLMQLWFMWIFSRLRIHEPRTLVYNQLYICEKKLSVLLHWFCIIELPATWWSPLTKGLLLAAELKRSHSGGILIHSEAIYLGSYGIYRSGIQTGFFVLFFWTQNMTL